MSKNIIQTVDSQDAQLPTTEQAVEKVRLAAYFLWEKAGCPHGEDERFWYEAERNFEENFCPTSCNDDDAA